MSVELLKINITKSVLSDNTISKQEMDTILSREDSSLSPPESIGTYFSLAEQSELRELQNYIKDGRIIADASAQDYLENFLSSNTAIDRDTYTVEKQISYLYNFGVASAVIGGITGGILGIETGPGVLLTAGAGLILGGIVGIEAGKRVAELYAVHDD